MRGSLLNVASGITCQELREELREELRRFANDTLSSRLTELGKRMRQGVQEDLHTILMGTPHYFASQPLGEPMWTSSCSIADHKAGASSAGTEELAPRVSHVFSESAVSRHSVTSQPRVVQATRHSVTSVWSGNGEGEDNDPDQLGWLSRCRRGFRLTKTLSYEKKKKRMRNKKKKQGLLSDKGRSSERRDSTWSIASNTCVNDRHSPRQNGCPGQATMLDGGICTPTCPASPPPERSALDITPNGGSNIAPLPPKVESGLAIIALDCALPVKEAKQPTGDESIGMLRHPKTFMANHEIGPLLRGKHHGLPKEGPDDKELDDHGEAGLAIQVTNTISQRKSASQMLDDAAKAKRVSHGGLRALLKMEETTCMGAATGMGAEAAELSGGFSGGMQQQGAQLRRSASFQTDDSCRDSNHSRVSSNFSSLSSGAKATLESGKNKVKSCCRRFLELLACCPLIELLTTPAADVVESYQFDYMSAILIAMNAICIGVETDYMARYLVEELPMYFVFIDWCFCICFSVELGLRLYVYGFSFFRMAGYRWNIFDTILVVMQVFEEVMEVAAISMTEGNDTAYMTSNLSIMRILRVLRLVRIIRLVRVMHLVSELRTIVVAIFGTLQSLMWTMALLLLVMYIMSVYLTQMVTAVLLGDPEQHVRDDLEMYYANVSLCILSLFQAITNGVDWKNMLDPLTTHVNPLLALVFCFYVGFSLFALMNIVTGVFVESALQTAKNDKDMFLLHHMTHLFMKTDVDESGEISWDEFQNQLDTPDMQEYFKAVDLDTEEARDLFRLIDVDSSGQIDAEEFVHGCLRLRGPAKAIDLATFMHDYRRTTRRWYRHSQSVERCLSQISSCLPELTRASSTTLRLVTSNVDNGLPPAPPPRKKGLSL